MKYYKIIYALGVIILVFGLLNYNQRDINQVKLSSYGLITTKSSPLVGYQNNIRSNDDVFSRKPINPILNKSPIEINWAALQKIRERGSGSLEINNLLNRFEVEVGSVNENPGGGYSMSGKLEGEPLSHFLATAHEDAFVASITTGDEIPQHFAIGMNALGVHEIQKINPNQSHSCEGAITPPIALSSEKPILQSDEQDQSPEVNADEVPGDETNTIIDVMIVYTAAAKNNRGGQSAIIAAANQAVNWTNIAFANSGLDLSYRLAHAGEVPYTESGSSNTDLRSLQDTDATPEIHALRDNYGADLVSLWTDSDYGGLGNLGALNRWTDGRFAFSVCSSSTQFGSSKIYSIFAHECGHNLGCGHGRIQDEEPGPSDTFREYGAGWRWTDRNFNQWRTIMVYRPGERVQHFSNPNVNYNGLPTGTATDDNARVISQMMEQVSNYRDRPFYQYSVEGDDITITDCDKSVVGLLSIPRRIQGKFVTKIADSAFRDCKDLTGVSLPSSLTTIEASAFYGCESLVNITIPDNVTLIGAQAFYLCKALTSINVGRSNSNYADDNGVLFNKEKTELIAYPIGSSLVSYTIPDGVTTIGEGAFRSCSNLQNVRISESVVSIGSNAFRFCTGLENIKIPDKVSRIGTRAFRACTNLRDISFLGDAPDLGDAAFDAISSQAWITYPTDGAGYSNPFGGVRSRASDSPPMLFSNQTFDVTELSEVGTVVGELVVGEAETDELSFSIVQNADPDGDELPAFSINGNTLIVADSGDLDLEYGENITVRVHVTDGSTLAEASITVNLIELDDFIALSASELPQNAVAFTLVGTLSTPDSDSENLTYRLLAETDPAPEDLIGFSDEWLYLDDGSDQGIGWREPEFNDEDWLAGDSPLGYGAFGNTTPTTLVSFGDDSNNKIPTTYFRTYFQIDDRLLVDSLSLELEVDDGAILYINGTEILRYRADGVVSYDDFASATAGTNDVPEVISSFVISEGLAPVLRKGINVIAVEVHQANGTSSDSWLNLSLLGTRRLPGLSDADHFYIIGDKLFINKSVIEANRSDGDTFKVPVQSIDELGNEYVGQVLVKVGPDSSSPPDAISLIGEDLLEQQSSGQLVGELSGSDPDGDSLNFSVIANPDYPDNQFFTVTGNSLVTTTAVDFDEVAELSILVTATDSTGLSYSEEFTVNVFRFEEPPTDIVLEPNVVDLNAKAGDLIGVFRAIDPNAGQDHTFEFGSWPSEAGEPIIPFGSSWVFLDDGSDQGTEWRGLDYDDTEWKVGVAELGYGDGDEATVVEFIDTDPLTDGVQKNATTYFRQVFEVDEPSAEGYIFRIIYDDAAIIHINGETVAGSASLPEGTQFDTFSEVTSSDNELTQYIQIPSGLISAGDNIIAVEIHQANNTSSDISFDFEFVPLVGVAYQEYFTIDGNELRLAGDISELGYEAPFTFQVPIVAIDPFAGSVERFVSVILDSVDSDNDGWDDETEILFGSLPDDASSVPSFEIKLSVTEDGEIDVLFPGEKDVSYTIQQSTDMEDWEPVKEFIIGQGAAVQETLQISEDLGFFRVVRD